MKAKTLIDDRFNFRAWDKHENMMLTHYQLMNADFSFDEFLVDPAVIIMQSTGLNDKNGKLIFEGDIIKSVCNMVNMGTGKPTGKISTKILSIEWSGEKPQFCYRDHSNKDRLESWCLYKPNVDKFYEIIGNIHENPELLTV